MTPRASITLDPRPESAGIARLFLRARVCRLHTAVVVDDAVLLVTELVANAIRYGRPPVTVELECDETHAMQVRVSDASPTLPQPLLPSVADPLRLSDDAVAGLDGTAGDPAPGLAPLADESGRGLFILHVLSDAWGVDPRSDGRDGKTVWFRIRGDSGKQGTQAATA